MSLNGPLRKIIELEQKKGYLDSAVIGGLDRFLQNRNSAGETITGPQLLKRFRKLVDGSSYATMPKPQRKEWATKLLKLLDEADADRKSTAEAPKKSPKRVAKPVTNQQTGDSLDAPITVIKGISTGLSARFAKLGVKTVRDLLYFFPHRHLDYSQVKTISQLKEGQEETIIANVWEARVSMPGGRRSTEATIGDATGNMRVVWFNQPYLAKKLTTNTRIVLSGKVGLFRGQHVFESPEWEILENQDLIHTGRLVPVYPLTEGLHQRQVRKLMKSLVDQYAWQVEDFLPAEIKDRVGLIGLPLALSQAHFPDSEKDKDRARVRLAFDELLLLQLGVMSKKRDWQQSQPGNPFETEVPLLETFLKCLPFALTEAQQKVLKEILADLRKSQAMSRLLQGEVGSGKTVVATAALLVAVGNGFQGAIMAPTEILAEQHFATLSMLLSRAGHEEGEGYLRSYSGLLPRPLNVALLLGDSSQAKKREVQARLKDGSIDIVIGTHALVQKSVGFHRLGLAVVDEQHRFGVEQRSALRQKGYSPHMLVMTATPIPRTLALTLYGDLDLSVIDQLPPGRQVIKTKWLRPDQRNSAYAFIRKQVVGGRQAFIICPLIEESDAVAAQAAVTEYQYLSKEVFSDLKLGLLHGRLSAKDKDEVMQRFRSGELNLLVSTPVVEVGTDVPNAAVMLVESADRFGLSQLHQFRGR
ncbi:MAG: ATP-dependent DNA helicase RecG, partial [Dehalococcoidales bacterium]|nr:ATP-dependent DNA helicase RecG [Dehalococcoidales bacterium]